MPTRQYKKFTLAHIKTPVYKAIIDYFFFWLIGTVVLASVFSYFLIVAPKRGALSKRAEEKVKQMEEDAVRKEKELQALKIQIKNLEKINMQDIKQIKKILPPLSQRNKVLFTINKLISEQGSHVISANIPQEGFTSFVNNTGENAVSLPLPVVVVPVNMTISGGGHVSYEAYKEFINVLYNKYQIFIIPTVKYASYEKSAAADAAKEGESSFNLDVLFFDDRKPEEEAKPREETDENQ